MGTIENLTYRVATIKDLQELKELQIAAYSPYATLMTAENANNFISVLKDEGKLVSLLSHSKNFVCVDEGKIIGMAFIVPHGNPWKVFKTEWSYIRMVGVHPDHQGKGIAKKLTSMCMQFAKETNEKIIALHTSEFMDAARHIYESVGFKKVEEIEPVFGKKYWLYLKEL